MKKKLKKIKDVIEVKDNLFIIKSPQPSSSNSILIYDEDVTLIDTGGKKEILGKFAKDIDMILNSHCHYNHIRGDGLFDEVRISKIEAPALKGPEEYIRMCGVNNPNIKREMKRIYKGEFWPTAVVPYSINKTLDLGNTAWKIIHTPGHSVGHCCFYEENLRVLITGDYGPDKFGPWYGLPSCDLPALVDSIKKIIDLNPEIALPSHSNPVTKDIIPKLRNYLNFIWERDRKIRNLYQIGRDKEEILKENIIYSEEAKSASLLKYFAKTMISEHLRSGYLINLDLPIFRSTPPHGMSDSGCRNS